MLLFDLDLNQSDPTLLAHIIVGAVVANIITTALPFSVPVGILTLFYYKITNQVE